MPVEILNKGFKSSCLKRLFEYKENICVFGKLIIHESDV